MSEEKETYKKMKREKSIKMGELKKTKNKKEIKEITKIIEENEKESYKKGNYTKSYRLRRCANKHGEIKQCKLWERNVNASKNMITKMRETIKKKLEPENQIINLNIHDSIINQIC
jgi:hypothetical protein